MEISYDIVWLVIGLFLYARVEWIVSKIEAKKPEHAPIMRLIVAFVTIASLIAGLPSLLHQSGIDVNWFFLPFTYLMLEFGNQFWKDFKKTAGRQRRLYVSAFGQYCSIFGVIAGLVFMLSPFINAVK